MYRLALDLNLGTARRLSRVPYVLSEKDGHVSDMTGMHRFYGETQDWVMHNTVMQGLTSMKAFLIYGCMDLVNPRPGNDPKRNFNCTGNFHRTISTPNMVGNSTPEGIHQDGAGNIPLHDRLLEFNYHPLSFYVNRIHDDDFPKVLQRRL